MAVTTHYKLDLFEGSEVPSQIKFNNNNEKIDTMLKVNSTHNHDGINSEKVLAEHIEFKTDEITINATNMQDAIEEVFTEADSKINEIRTAIGTEVSQSNQERATVMTTEGFEGRNSYLAHLKNYSGLVVEGKKPTIDSSIDEIADAVRNTVIQGVTAGRYHLRDGNSSVDKHGNRYNGALHLSEARPFKFTPTQNEVVTISPALYHQIKLEVAESSTHSIIKKGATITNTAGTATYQKPLGWDVGDNIRKTKVITTSTDKMYAYPNISSVLPVKSDPLAKYRIIQEEAPTTLPYQPKAMVDYRKAGSSYKIISSKTPFTFQNMGDENTLPYYVSNNNIAINIRNNFINYGTVHHESAKDTAKSHSESFGINDSEHEYFSNMMCFNAYSNSSTGDIGKLNKNSTNQSFSFGIVCCPTEKGAGIVGTRVMIHNLLYKHVMYEQVLPFNAVDIIIPKNSNDSISYINAYILGRDFSGNFSYLKIIISKADSVTATLVDCNDYLTTYDNSLILNAKSFSTPLLGTTHAKQFAKWTDDSLRLDADSSVVLTNTAFKESNVTRDITVRLKKITSSSGYTIEGVIDGVITKLAEGEAFRDLHDVTVTLPAFSLLTIRCRDGQFEIREIFEGDNNLVLKSNLQKRAKYLTHTLFAENPDEVFLLFGATEYNTATNECTSKIIVNEPIDYSNINFNTLRLNPIKTANMSETNIALIDNQGFLDETDYSTHRFFATSLISNNLIFSSYGDAKESISSVTGLNWPVNNRKLFEMVYTDSNIEFRLKQQHKSYKVFRPFYLEEGGSILGIEQSCTNRKFTYITQLDDFLVSTKSDVMWGECEMKPIAEDLAQPADNTLETLNNSLTIRDCIYPYVSEGEQGSTIKDYRFMFANIIERELKHSYSSSGFIKAVLPLGGHYGETEKHWAGRRLNTFNGLYKIIEDNTNN